MQRVEGWVVNQRKRREKGEEEEELRIQHENYVHYIPSMAAAKSTWKCRSIHKQCAHFSLSITLTDTHHRRERREEEKKEWKWNKYVTFLWHIFQCYFKKTHLGVKMLSAAYVCVCVCVHEGFAEMRGKFLSSRVVSIFGVEKGGGKVALSHSLTLSSPTDNITILWVFTTESWGT